MYICINLYVHSHPILPGMVFVHQRGDGDVITSLTESVKVTKEIKESISILWKACLHFKMFSVGREEEV
jgi:hypothetical protein